MKKADLTGLSSQAIEYISSLETQVQEQTNQLQEQSQTVESQKVRIDHLLGILANLQKSMYGQSSEKSKYGQNKDNLQGSLFNEAEAEANRRAPEPDKVVIAEHIRKAKRSREELVANAPVVEILCELNTEQLVCGECGDAMRVLGKEAVREELEIIPAQIRLLRYIRYSYVCKSCELETGEATIIKAPVPAPVIKKSLASPSTVAHVMYQKYVNAMPLYRQEKDWANQGIILGRATLANWMIRSATDWLEPLWESFKAQLLAQPVIHADETVIQVLKEEGKNPSSDSRMWVYCSGHTAENPVVLFEYQPTRSGEHARRFLHGFHGYLQTDGYSGYDKVVEVSRCGCWTHLRRKYQEAMPKAGTLEDSAAAVGWEYCNQLFALEKKWKTLSPEERKELRQEQSKLILDAYWSWLSSLDVLRGGNLAKAVTYSANQKAALSTFLEDGRIELSNNQAENAIRPFVIGRKGWLFADTTLGAKSSAIIYSIVETAKANDLNVYMYLVHLFSQMPSIDFISDPSLLEDLMPWSSALPDYCRKPKEK